MWAGWGREDFPEHMPSKTSRAWNTEGLGGGRREQEEEKEEEMTRMSGMWGH